jgi:hypothetical protein
MKAKRQKAALLPGAPLYKRITSTLAQPRQVLCVVRGQCAASPATFFRLVLQHPDGRVVTVSETLANPWTTNTLQVGASLYLPAGTYTWTAELGRTVGGPPPGGDIANFEAVQLPADALLQGKIGSVGVVGHSGGWFLASCARDGTAFGALTVSGELAEGTWLAATVLLQPPGGPPVQSYPAEIRAPAHPPLRIEIVPCRLRAGLPTKVSYTLSPQPPQAPTVCSLGLAG